MIISVYHVPSLNVNLFSKLQLTQIGKMVELWLDRFVVKDINNAFVILVEGILDPKYILYKLCNWTLSRIQDWQQEQNFTRRTQTSKFHKYETDGEVWYG